MRGVIHKNGKVTRVLTSEQVENNTDWLAVGIPQGVIMVDDDSPVVIGDYVSDKGEIDTLGHIKEKKLADLKSRYDDFDRNASTVVSLGFPIQCGQGHIQKFDGAVRFAEQTGAQTVYITDANDVTHYGVPLADAKHALLEVTAQSLKAHALKQSLREAIINAKSLDELDQLRWTM